MVRLHYMNVAKKMDALICRRRTLFMTSKRKYMSDHEIMSNQLIPQLLKVQLLGRRTLNGSEDNGAYQVAHASPQFDLVNK